jgi:hypothetical protein
MALAGADRIYLELDSFTLEELLLSFGSPAPLSAQAEEAASGCG